MSTCKILLINFNKRSVVVLEQTLVMSSKRSNYALFFQLRFFKKQIEEAEEIAALNLAKFRHTQVDLEEGEERADLNEQALAKFKAMGRSRGATPLPGQTLI
jgi:hypothetical protein